MPTTLEQRAQYIEDPEKREIISAFKRVDGKMYVNRSDMKVLFKAFDRHVEPYSLNSIDCNSCRVAILAFWRRVVKLWE